ncbi:MAG TPA: hypothetical protein VNK52_12185 [Hyphomicrobiaceae bacterium]|nr:hypothetical protein [Hyphomicrobiaceae bacterium]
MSPAFRSIRATALAALMLIAAADPLAAQTKPGAESRSQQPPKAPDKPAAKAPAAVKPAVPDANKLAILIQTAVTALSQANVTGNYTVLHALAAPGFQKDNPPAKLAETFADLRAKGIDLTPIIIFSPILMREPAIDENGMLRLTGYYKTAPQRVYFDLLFQLVGEQWRLYGIAVRTAPAS